MNKKNKLETQKKRHPVCLFFVFLCILLLPQSLQADEVSRAALLSYTCAGCHGTDGKSPGSIPSIPCSSSTELEKVLLSFREGKRFSTVMGRHIKAYSDAEIRLIAGFFASQCGSTANTK